MTDLLNYFPIELVSFLPSALANLRELNLVDKKTFIIKWVLMVCSTVLPMVLNISLDTRANTFIQCMYSYS